jgi:hypothetical protein
LKLSDVVISVENIAPKFIPPYETVQKVKIIGAVDGYKLVKEVNK